MFVPVCVLDSSSRRCRHDLYYITVSALPDQSSIEALTHACRETHRLTTEHPSQNRFTLDLTFIPRICPSLAIAECECGIRDAKNEIARDVVA